MKQCSDACERFQADALHQEVKQGERSHGKQCSLCGGIYHNIAFRGGYVCEDCVNYLKHKTDG